MSADITPEVRQQRAKEFLQILPLTMEIAGLPDGQIGMPYNADQMDVRCMTLKTAYKLARKLLREVSEDA
ncbi:hypothetical protein BH11PLA2_BH11PLA2_02320 [soil metagenome]